MSTRHFFKHTNIVMVLLFCIAPALFAETGKELFFVHCSGCHGVDGKGNGKNALQSSTKPKDLTTLSQTNGGYFPYVYLRKVIDGRLENGKSRTHLNGDMPVWGKVFAEEKGSSATSALSAEAMTKMRILDIVDYIATLQEQCIGECR